MLLLKCLSGVKKCLAQVRFIHKCEPLLTALKYSPNAKLDKNIFDRWENIMNVYNVITTIFLDICVYLFLNVKFKLCIFG